MEVRPRRFITSRDWPQREPPPRRKVLLAFLQAEREQARPFPTMRQIADHMGWHNEQSSRDALMGLIRDGWVRMAQDVDAKRKRIYWELR